MAESIIILDDDEEDTPQPSSSSAASSSVSAAQLVANHHISPLTAQQQQPVPTHLIRSPLALAKKDSHALQTENQTLVQKVRQTITD